MRHESLFALLLLATGACATHDTARRDSADGAIADSPRSSATAAMPDTTGRNVSKTDRATTVRALYVNRFAAQSPKRMKQMIAIADETEINGLVLDIKDEFGLNYASKDTLVQRNAGRAGTIPHLTQLLDTLRAHGIVSIARLVTFKDSVAARVNPGHTIRKADGSAWHDKQGLTWVDPYDQSIWEYNIRVAEEMARAGFDEIQFDYIRFPEPYRSLPEQHFPDQRGRSKAQVLQDFLRTACKRINAAGARCTADIFGLVTTVRGPLEIGQEWEKVSPVVQVVLPMTYPSHYPRGSFNLPKPNAEPQKVLEAAVSKAHARDIALKISEPEHVRPWLQAFTLGSPAYGPPELEAQKRGVYAAGYDGWVLWNPGSKYELFLPGLEKTLVSRKQPYPRAATASAPAVDTTTAKHAADSTVREVRTAAPRSDSGAIVKP